MDHNTPSTSNIGRRGYLGGLSSLVAAAAYSLTVPPAAAAQVTDGHDDPVQTVTSPDGSITVTLDVEDGTPTYSVERDGTTLVGDSELGFEFQNQPSLDGGLTVTGSESETVDETWTPVWDQYDEIRDNHVERRVGLREESDPGRALTVVIRVFDDGIAFRYVFPEDSGFGEFVVTSERTQFAVDGDPTAWWIEHDFDSYEYEYKETPLSDLGGSSPTGGAHTPITMRTDDGHYMSLHEAELVDYASMGVVADEGETTLTTDLAPLPDGTKVTASAPHRTPWRTLQITDRAGGLIESSLIVNCNEPRDPDHFPQGVDWITPQKYVGIWWLMITERATWQYYGPDSGNHGAQTARMKQYMEFASEHGIDSVLVEGWNEGWDSYPGSGDTMDFDQTYGDFDIEEVTEFGASLDPPVEMTAHNETAGNTTNYESQLTDDDSVFAYYDDLGIHSIKTGYVADNGVSVDDVTHNHHCQPLVNHHHLVYREAAANRQMLNVHEPVKPTGERRRFPNVMTKEGVRGQEYDSFGGIDPSHHVTFPFTRMIAGPVEYTPGIFDMDSGSGGIETTRAKQLAMYPTYLSGLQMAADIVGSYIDDSDDSVAVGEVTQAEFGERSDVGTGARWANAQAAGYVVFDPAQTSDGSSVTFTATDVPESGEYDVHVRYSRETPGEGSLTLETDETTTTIGFPTTERWDTWESTSETVTLPAGESTVTLTQTPEDGGGAYLDAVAITAPADPMPDPPESPIREPTEPAFQFIEDVPAAGWDDTVVVDAAIGEYTVTARRKGEEWFLGAMTGDTGRALDIPLSFLDGEYVAEVYSDGPDAEWDTNLTDVTVEEVIVDESTTLSASMVTSGGMAVRFRPPEDGEADSLPTYEGPNQSVSVSLASAVGFGEPFVSVTGENTGSAVGGTLLEVVVDGEVAATELVRIPAGESDYSGTLSASIGGGGEYDVVVRGADGETLAEGTVTVSADAGSGGTTTESTTASGFGPGFTGLSGLLGVAGGTAYALRRHLADADSED